MKSAALLVLTGCLTICGVASASPTSSSALSLVIPGWTSFHFRGQTSIPNAGQHGTTPTARQPSAPTKKSGPRASDLFLPENKKSDDTFDRDAAIVEARRGLRRNQRLLRMCDRIAWRRGEVVPSKLHFIISVSAAGKATVTLENSKLTPRVQACYQAMVRSWKVPEAGEPYRLRFTRYSTGR